MQLDKHPLYPQLIKIDKQHVFITVNSADANFVAEKLNLNSKTRKFLATSIAREFPWFTLCITISTVMQKLHN